MTDDKFAKAWRTTAVKQGVALGALNGDAFAATHASASLAIPAGATLAERRAGHEARVETR
jgi:hypothetical protein